MREHPISPKVRELWKTLPLRIQANWESECCGIPTLLVQSMDGGYVTRNCSDCGEKATLPNHAFLNDIDLWVSCPECRERMEPDMVEKNYAYVCASCGVWIKLASLLPKWEDLV